MSCWTPPSRLQAWRTGVVTLLTPLIQRDCGKLYAGDKDEFVRVKEQLESWENPVTDTIFYQDSFNCPKMLKYFTGNLYTTKLERTFPIAFNLLVHNDLQQVVRLLRFLYRPHNTYCVHPDKKSSLKYTTFFRNLASCLGNVIVPESLVDVHWGEYTIMEAQMLCLKELVSRRAYQSEATKWRYVINLCGKELPMATNHEMVSKLARLNGSSSFITARAEENKETMRRLRKQIIPHNFPYYKSMTYGAISYTFADFLLTNDTAQELYRFFRTCIMPEEHFYATAYMIPGVPGGYDPKLKHLYFTVDMYIWLSGSNAKKHCGGRNVHNICVVSVEELKEVVYLTKDGRRAIFHNKYFMYLDHVVMDCAEEKLVARNKLEYQQDCATGNHKQSNASTQAGNH